MAEWFEDRRFWEDFAPVMFDGERWAEVPAVVDGLLRLGGVAPGAAILDLCCGPGRHALELAARGYRVTGVDITKSFLDAAADSAADRGLSLELVEADARAFERPGAFALCANLFTSFGYFSDARDDALVARRVFSSLEAGGTFVVDTLAIPQARRDYSAPERFEREGWSVACRYAPVGDWDGLETSWTIERGGARAERRFVQRLYTEERMRSLLEAAGFAEVRCFGSWAGEAYGPESSLFIAVARKA